MKAEDDQWFLILHMQPSHRSLLQGHLKGFRPLHSLRHNMLSSIRDQWCWWFLKALFSKLTSMKLQFLRNSSNFTFTLLIKLLCFAMISSSSDWNYQDGRNYRDHLRRISLGQNPVMLWFIVSDDFCCSVKWGTFEKNVSVCHPSSVIGFYIYLFYYIQQPLCTKLGWLCGLAKLFHQLITHKDIRSFVKRHCTTVWLHQNEIVLLLPEIYSKLHIKHKVTFK